MHGDEKEGEHSSNAEKGFENGAAAMLNHAFLPLDRLKRANANNVWPTENRQL
jgi:hypothetical protein